MRNNPNTSDSKFSDIYSLAKTLWVLLSKERYAFEGAYSRYDNKITLDNIYSNDFNTILHQVLEKTTRNEPSERLSLKEFIDLLIKHKNVEKNFLEQCKIEWKELEFTLFNEYTPNEVCWENDNDICVILNLIGKRRQLNHLFFPSGGGLDVEGQSKPINNGFIEVKLGSTFYQFKPIYLKFYSVNNNPEYNFFGIECENVQPKFPKYARSYIEDLIEIEKAGEITYVSDLSDESEENIETNNARKICRVLGGKLLITSKKSVWNMIPDSYSGLHNNYEFDSFRDMLLKLSDKIQNTGV
jgi:hypothetical protein